MLVNSAVCLVLFLASLNMAFSFSQKRFGKSFREPAKYCGPRLTEQLHDFCKYFYGPSDLTPQDTSDRQLIAEECCEAPCSILYIILSYCKQPKAGKIMNTFGKAEVELYESLVKNISNITLEDLNGNKTSLVLPLDNKEKNIRKKKHTRKQRRKKRLGKGKKSQKQIRKEKLLVSRKVPEYIIGLVDFQDNEPIIIANSL